MNLNKNHSQFFSSSSEILLFYGGAGSGKSYSVADKIILNAIIHTKQKLPIKILVIRKSYPSLRRTCYELIVSRLNEHKIPHRINKLESTITILENVTLYFLSMNNPSEYEKVKSMTDITMIWIEEANELTLSAFEVVNLRLRGGQDIYKQIILTFNPISINNWIYDIFFVKNKYHSEKIRVNYKSNPYIDEGYIKKLEDLKEANEQLYNVYCLGEWGQLQEVIYNNYTISRFNEKVSGEKIYGLDFGFNNPSALVEVQIKDGVYYVTEKLYQSGLTNSELIQLVKPIVNQSIVYCDSAEPQRIEEFKRAGINAKPAEKSVKDGIDYVKSLKLVINEDSDNLLRELQTYCWKKVDDKILDEPVKYDDHVLDSLRYVCFSHRRKNTHTESKVYEIDDNFKY